MRMSRRSLVVDYFMLFAFSAVIMLEIGYGFVLGTLASLFGGQ
jgi:hypothetical protein